MPNLAYQLYCSREFPPLEKTAKMLVDSGYAEVEGFPGNFQDVANTKAVLDAHNLTMPSGHFGLDALEGDLRSCVGIARELGMISMYAPYIVPDERPTDIAGWQAYAGRLAVMGKKVRDEGFHFGWHNHDFELARLEDGSTPLDILFGADEQLQWEADLAWVAVGKASPLECISKYQNRITSVHIKDIAPAGQCEDEDGWADVGHGTLDWPRLLKAVAASPVRHYVVEHDKPSDDARFASRSAEFLKQHLQDL